MAKKQQVANIAVKIKYVFDFDALPKLNSPSKHTLHCDTSLACWVREKPTNDRGLVQMGE